MKAWLKKWWWMILLGLGLAVGALLFIFRKKEKRTVESSFTSRAREKIVEAETDASIQRAKAEAKSEAARKRLDEIDKIEDGEERRRELASYLNKIL